ADRRRGERDQPDEANAEGGKGDPLGRSPREPILFPEPRRQQGCGDHLHRRKSDPWNAVNARSEDLPPHLASTIPDPQLAPLDQRLQVGVKGLDIRGYIWRGMPSRMPISFVSW